MHEICGSEYRLFLVNRAYFYVRVLQLEFLVSSRALLIAKHLLNDNVYYISRVRLFKRLYHTD